MKFISIKSYRISRFLFSIFLSLIIGLIIYLKTSFLYLGISFCFFLFGMLIFDYFNYFEGEPSGKEKMKIDKTYRIRTYWYFVALIIILIVFEILRYITLTK